MHTLKNELVIINTNWNFKNQRLSGNTVSVEIYTCIIFLKLKNGHAHRVTCANFYLGNYLGSCI